MAVFVETEREVDARGCEEFSRTGGGFRGGLVGYGAADCVDGVGGGVGAEVEGGDEQGGFGAEEAVRAG